MNTKEVKDIRKQIRNIAQELAPTALASEAGNLMYRQLMEAVAGKLNSIELEVKETLKRIDERSIDLQSYAMRQISNMIQAPKVAENSQGEMNKSEEKSE